MGIKEFWGNRSYLQKGFIIGILLYALFFVYIFIVSSNPIRRSDLFFIFVYGPLFFVVLFGYIGFLIGLLKKDERDRIVNTIRMKDEGHFLKPHKGKVLITFVAVMSFFVLMGIFCLFFKKSVCYFLFFNELFEPMMTLLYILPEFSLFILVLLAYSISCFRFKSKKMWLLSAILAIMIFIGISHLTFYGIQIYDENYNAAKDNYCDTDPDCFYSCPTSSNPFMTPNCEPVYGVCENHRCMALDIKDVKDCERLQHDVFGQATCYKRFARELNDPSLCDKIGNEGFKETCKREFG